MRVIKSNEFMLFITVHINCIVGKRIVLFTDE